MPDPDAPSKTAEQILARLRDITSAINSGGGLEQLLDRVLVAVCDNEPWSRGGIMAVNRASGFSERVAGFAPGEDERTLRTAKWPLATSPALRVAESRRPLVMDDAQREAGYPAYQQDAIARGYCTVVLLPLGCTTADGHDMVLSIHTAERVVVSKAELDFLKTVAHLVAIAAEKAKHLLSEQRQSERLRRVLEAGSNLMELVLAGASLPVTAGAIGAILPDPFVILDFVTDTTIARRSPVPDDLSEREWSALVEGAAAPLLAALADRVGAGGAAVDGTLRMDSVGLALALPVRTEPLRVDAETVGALLVFPRNRLLDSLDRVVTQEVRFALSAQVMRHHAEAKREAQDLAAFFEQLCRTGAADPARLGARAARLGLDLGRPTQLLAVTPPSGAGDASLPQLRRLLTVEMQRGAAIAMVIEQDSAIVVGWRRADPATPIAASLLDRHLMQPVRARWGAQPTVAFGPVCTAPADYQAAWGECSRVLHLARMFRRDGLVCLADFGAFALLLSALDGPAVHRFVDGTLGPMRRHDAEHGGDLVGTLVAFIDEACRYQTTAERLGIHVSTLRYRLRRVQELFGFDLEDAETRFRIALATRLEAAGSPGPVSSPPAPASGASAPMSGASAPMSGASAPMSGALAAGS